MRIIGGVDRSKRLTSPPDNSIRPTASLMREALFNILQDRIEGATFLDLYAGTGAVGLEALSRGAASVTFVESGAEALRVLRENISKMSRPRDAIVRTASAPAQVRSFQKEGRTFDLIFIDPPYDVPGMPIDLVEPILAEGGLAIHQRPTRNTAGDPFKGTRLTRIDLRKYGKSELSFWSFEPDQAISSDSETEGDLSDHGE